MHPGNAYYGHGRILADYTGRFDSPRLWGHLQHGWTGGRPQVATDRLAPWLPVLAWDQASAAACRRAGVLDAVAIGAPFLYLAELRRRLGDIRLRPGPLAQSAKELEDVTIFYPFHSTDRTSIEGSHHRLADEVADRYGTGTTVCLYWTDHARRDVRDAYEGAGLSIISHGRRDDPLFLHRQIESLLGAGRVASNRLCTALWYAGSLGRAIEVTGPTFVGAAEDAAAALAFEQTYAPELFEGGLRDSRALERAGAELGAENLRAPDELAAVVGLERPAAMRAMGSAVVRADLQLRTARSYAASVRRPSDVADLWGRARRRRLVA